MYFIKFLLFQPGSLTPQHNKYIYVYFLFRFYSYSRFLFMPPIVFHSLNSRLTVSLLPDIVYHWPYLKRGYLPSPTSGLLCVDVVTFTLPLLLPSPPFSLFLPENETLPGRQAETVWHVTAGTSKISLLLHEALCILSLCREGLLTWSHAIGLGCLPFAAIPCHHNHHSTYDLSGMGSAACSGEPWQHFSLNLCSAARH